MKVLLCSIISWSILILILITNLENQPINGNQDSFFKKLHKNLKIANSDGFQLAKYILQTNKYKMETHILGCTGEVKEGSRQDAGTRRLGTFFLVIGD